MSVIETRGDLRLHIADDNYASEPYSDGSSPLLRMSVRRWSAGNPVEQVPLTSFEVPDEIIAAAARFGFDVRFHRYLRIFHGVTCVEMWQSGEMQFCTFDTQAWREAMGLTDEYLAAHPEIARPLANMDEWKAYVYGEVYGWVVEKRVTWRRDGDPSQTMTTWETVESCWGYYGYEYAEEVGRGAFEGYLTEKGESQ